MAAESEKATVWRKGKMKPLLPAAMGGAVLVIGFTQSCGIMGTSGNLMAIPEDANGADTATDVPTDSAKDQSPDNTVAANLMALPDVITTDSAK